MGKNITLAEIAEKISISRTTIYKVINEKGYVSPATRKKVFDALEKYGYTLNHAARNLAKNKRYRIGMSIFACSTAPYFDSMIEVGIKKAEEKYCDFGMEVIVDKLNYPNDGSKTQIAGIKRLIEEEIDALIVIPIDAEKTERFLKTSFNKPVIILNRNIPFNSSYPYVGCDYINSGRMIAELLGNYINGQGFILPVISSEILDDFYCVQRLKGIMEGMNRFRDIQLLSPLMVGKNQDISAQLKEHLVNKRGIVGIVDITAAPLQIARVLDDMNLQCVKFACFDLFEGIDAYIHKGIIDFAIFQDIIGQSYSALTKLFSYLCYENEKEYCDEIKRLDIVIESNIDYFINLYQGE